MAAATYTESGAVFEFSPGWIVKKFDAHRYYRWLSGQGFKGVDFLAFRPNDSLLCIEVKNYRGEPPTPSVIADTFCKKISGTLKIVEIIEQYYLRKPLYRLTQKWIRRWPQYFGEWGFWSEVAELALNRHNCVFVLWMETMDNNEEFHKLTKGHIRQQLSADIRFYVLPYDQQQEALGLKVTSEN